MIALEEKMGTTFIIGLTASLAMMACGTSKDGSREKSAEEKIVGGSAVSDGSTGPARRSAVALSLMKLIEKGRSFCSSTLVGDQLLLTAAHCVTNGDGSIADRDVYAVFSTEVGEDAPRRHVTAVAVHRDYDPHVIGNVDPETRPMNDVALLFFEGTPPDEYRAMPLIDGSSLAKGDEVLLAGFGVTSTRSENDTGSLRQVKATIKDLDNPGHVLILRGPDLDGVRAYQENPQTGDTELVRGTGGSCAGDSGGPAYVRDEDGHWSLVGVTSYGTELHVQGMDRHARYCVGDNGYVDVRHYVKALRNGARAVRESATGDHHSHWRFTDDGIERD